MSTVFIQVGQCGNQVGNTLWKKIAKDEEVLHGHSFICSDGHYRAVCVDSETKVITKLLKGQPYRKKSMITGKRGRGTNWALGYNGVNLAGDDHLLENTTEAVRQEVERCDCFNGVILLHSLSGGTGSGFGSRLIEYLRDQYTMNHILSCTFAPCASGESPLQHYNSLLSLASLQRNADCIVLTQNDDILYRVQKRKGEESSVSFANLNDMIASQLAGVFLPTDSLKTKMPFSLGMEPWEMVRSVSPMPNLKFVQINQLSRSQSSWEGIMNQLSATVKRYTSNGVPFSSLADLVIARGDTTGGFHLHTETITTKIKQTYNCVEWNPFPVDLWSGGYDQQFSKFYIPARRNVCSSKNTACLTVVSNTSSVEEYLTFLFSRSKVMYEAGAYLHWYWRHGAEKEQFLDAFNDVQTVIDDYKAAVK